jgi:hypothetical protein
MVELVDPKKEYEAKFHRNNLLANQAGMTSLVALQVFARFPRNLPPVLKTGLTTILKAESAKSHELADSLDQETLAFIEYSLLAIEQKEHLKPNETKLVLTGFKRLILSQELVMHVACLEAFQSDTMRAICAQQPNVLKIMERQYQAKDVLDTRNWQDLISMLTEDFIMGFSLTPVDKKIDTFEKRFGMQLGLSNRDIRKLVEITNVRHIIVHNGGRVSREFIERTENRAIAEGKLFPLTQDYLANVWSCTRDFVDRMYEKTIDKFFT